MRTIRQGKPLANENIPAENLSAKETLASKENPAAEENPHRLLTL